MALSGFSSLSRAQAIKTGLALSGGIAGAVIGGCASPGGSSSAPVSTSDGTFSAQQLSSLGVTPDAISQNVAQEIQNIIQAQGMISNGVLNIEIDRDDINDVMLRGVHILPSFQINGNLVFQGFGGGDVFMNADIALKASEIDPFIDQLLAHNIVFQAEHQHFYDFEPDV